MSTTTGRPTAAGINKKIEEEAADRILELLDRGELPPWEKQWRDSPMAKPMNAISMKPYRGVNRWLTLMTQELMQYKDPRWLTFKQAQDLGGTVLKGETGTHVTFWKRIARRKRDGGEDEEKDNTFPILRTYTVFNLGQTEACRVKPLPEPELKPGTPIDRAEEIIRDMPNPPSIEHYQHSNQAPHYVPGEDLVRVPNMERYNDPEFYYNTIFHELTHATGHPRRLNRFGEDANRGDLHKYGREELVAAMGAAMLGAHAQIGTRILELDASYIQNWRDTIAGDKPMVIRAATLAQKAVDHILMELQNS